MEQHWRGLVLPKEHSVAVWQLCRVLRGQRPGTAQPGNGNGRCREGNVPLQCRDPSDKKALELETAACCSLCMDLHPSPAQMVLLEQVAGEVMAMGKARGRWGCREPWVYGSDGKAEEQHSSAAVFLCPQVVLAQ